jgi:hypothetical protein
VVAPIKADGIIDTSNDIFRVEYFLTNNALFVNMIILTKIKVNKMA